MSLGLNEIKSLKKIISNFTVSTTPADGLAPFGDKAYMGKIVLFYNNFSPSSEHPEQHILAYKQSNQLPVV